MSNNIREIVDRIKKKYKTSSPYELADVMNIKICRCNLGTIHGYFYRAYRVNQIILNNNLTRHEEKFVLSHELGHSVIHSTANTPFLKASTYMSVDKLEIEANKFAIELLISDSDLLEFKNYSIEELSCVFGYHPNIIKLRLK